MWLRLLTLLILSSLVSSGLGQAIPSDLRYDLLEVARVNDGAFTVSGTRGTLRWGENIAYFFAGSQSFILNGKDVRLSSAIARREAQWLVPRDFLEALQLEYPDPVRDPANLGKLELTWEELDLGGGVRGLHLFHREGDLDTASLLLLEFTDLERLDKGLAGSVKKVVAGFTAAQPGKLLYFSIAAQVIELPPTQLEFIQGKTRYRVESGAGLYPLDGIYPASSIGAVKLPAYFDLRSPVRVVWGASSADYVFER
jgi:hypothetical protein